ncbi:MAG TPA: immunoglobulin domain-containing protein [Luteolibacter sp.]|nr:immunoglobulin domain-containing protein [Luteolibacter sp.]
MKNPRVILRRLYNRLSPLLLLFQRSPFVQMLLPEAKIIGFAGGGEAAKWTIATIAGLGAYDSVSGASGVVQTYPQPNSLTINTAVGARFQFITDPSTSQFICEPIQFQPVGTIGNAKSWSYDFPMPPGLSYPDLSNSAAGIIVGTPTEEGEYPLRVTAYRGTFQTDVSLTQDFTIIVGPAVITTHPASASITSGSTRTLSVTATGSPLTYQWFRGNNPATAVKISGATSPNYTTPALTTTTTYMVMVKRGTIISFSDPATLTISANNTFADWRTSQFNSTQLADANISGPTADPDGDGTDNTKEYVFGTLALTRENPPMAMSLSGSNVSLTFTARQATGAGYSGRTRHYAIEASPSLGSGSWSSPPGYSDITGANQTVNYVTARGSTPMFYRLKVWLTP